MFRNMSPSLLAEEITSVQPIADNSYSDLCAAAAARDIYAPEQGDRRHDFALGWQRYYDNEWIDESLWNDLKAGCL